MDSAETTEDPEDAEAEEKLHLKQAAGDSPGDLKCVCSIWAARCSGVSSPSGEALALIQMSFFSRSGYLHAISSPILAPSLNPSRWTEERCKWLSRAITSSAISSVENRGACVDTTAGNVHVRGCPSESPENQA